MKEDFDDADLGFAPAVTDNGDVPAKPRKARRSRSGLRRRLSGALVLLAALTATGGAYAAFATTSGASAAQESKADIEEGRRLYEVSCISCHGANLQGVLDRGPTLVGVGAGATYFQVITGRMPAPRQGAEVERKPAFFTEEQTRKLAAYVQSMGGGPTIPEGDLRDGNIAEGGELFRTNCASCHGTGGQGAPLSAGKKAPGLFEATDVDMYLAMLTGPENMPVFSDNHITPHQKKSIIRYIQTLKASQDPGGHGIGRYGPAIEGLVVWLVGMTILMGTILWIGGRA